MLQSWQTFYATIASSSATLTGLLFVSLTINREKLDARTRQIARRTFAGLIDVLVLALIFLIPHQAPSELSITLVVFGAARLVSSLVEAIQLAKKVSPTFFSASSWQDAAMPILLSLGIVVLGLSIYFRISSAMYWPVAIVVLLLGSASWNAWELLFKD